MESLSKSVGAVDGSILMDCERKCSSLAGPDELGSPI